MPKDESEIDELKFRIFELETAILACNIRIKAFQDFAIETWKAQGLQNFDASEIQKVLKETQGEIADRILSQYADEKPMMASILKQYLDRDFDIDPPQD